MANIDIQISQLPELTNLVPTDILVVKRGIIDYRVTFSELFKIHSSNTNNPHGVTKTQVGLGQVVNELQLVASNNLADVVSVGAARTSLDIFSKAEVNSQIMTTHGSLTNNPHSVTKAQVGLSTVNNGGWSNSYTLNSGGTYATSKAIFDGLSNALSVGAADLTNHINTTNPHNITKAQVGLGSVNNGSWSNSYTSNSATSYATSKAVFDGVNNAKSTASSALSGHTGNSNNPHSVNKADVGLGSVNNWGATSTWNNNSTSVYATTRAVYTAYSQATSFATNAVNAHINNKSDPHNVTASQVGLGSVNNWSASSSYTSSSASTYATSKAVRDAVSSANSYTDGKLRPDGTYSYAGISSEYLEIGAGAALYFSRSWNQRVRSTGSASVGIGSRDMSFSSSGTFTLSITPALFNNGTQSSMLTLQRRSSSSGTWYNLAHIPAFFDADGNAVNPSITLQYYFTSGSQVRVINDSPNNSNFQQNGIGIVVSKQ